MPPDWYSRLLHSLARTLHAIREQLVSISENQRTQQSRESPPPGLQQRVRNEVDFPPEVVSRYYSEQDKNYRLQKRIFWVGLFTLLSLALYTCEVHKQTDILHQQLVGTEGAALVFTSDVGQVGVQISLQNRGLVSARNVVLDLAIHELAIPASGTDIFSYRHKFGPLVIVPTVNGALPFMQTVIPDNWGNEALQLFKDLKQTLRIEGTLSYENGFGGSFREDICRSYLEYSFVNVAFQRVAAPQFVPCDQFEDALKSAMKRAREEDNTKSKQLP